MIRYLLHWLVSHSVGWCVEHFVELFNWKFGVSVGHSF